MSVSSDKSPNAILPTSTLYRACLIKPNRNLIRPHTLCHTRFVVSNLSVLARGRVHPKRRQPLRQRKRRRRRQRRRQRRRRSHGATVRQSDNVEERAEAIEDFNRGCSREGCAEGYAKGCEDSGADHEIHAAAACKRRVPSRCWFRMCAVSFCGRRKLQLLDTTIAMSPSLRRAMSFCFLVLIVVLEREVFQPSFRLRVIALVGIHSMSSVIIGTT